jgi:MFS family permease
LFFVSIPLGYALGFVVGGWGLNGNYFGPDWTWRALFLLEGILMLLLIFCISFIKGPKSIRDLESIDSAEQRRKSSSLSNHENSGFRVVVRNLILLLKNPVYLMIVVGYTSQTFVLGGFSYAFLYFNGF